MGNAALAITAERRACGGAGSADVVAGFRSSEGWAAVPGVSPRKLGYRGFRARDAGSAGREAAAGAAAVHFAKATTPVECSPGYLKSFAVFTFLSGR